MTSSTQTFRIAGAVFLGLLMLAATGCVVRSEQLDLTRQLTQGGSIDADRFAWRMTFNDTEATVYAVSVGGGIVFASREGLEIAFDGADVLVVSGMPGALGMIRVDKHQDPRAHHVQGLDQVFDVKCEARESIGNGWRTRCRHDDGDRVYAMNHEISIAANGDITRIEASLVPGVGPMVLMPMFQVGN